MKWVLAIVLSCMTLGARAQWSLDFDEDFAAAESSELWIGGTGAYSTGVIPGSNTEVRVSIFQSDTGTVSYAAIIATSDASPNWFRLQTPDIGRNNGYGFRCLTLSSLLLSSAYNATMEPLVVQKWYTVSMTPNFASFNNGVATGSVTGTLSAATQFVITLRSQYRLARISIGGVSFIPMRSGSQVGITRSDTGVFTPIATAVVGTYAE